MTLGFGCGVELPAIFFSNLNVYLIATMTFYNFCLSVNFKFMSSLIGLHVEKFEINSYSASHDN